MFAADTGLKSGPVDPMAYVKMFIGLIATIALIFLLAWIGRKTRLLQAMQGAYQIRTLASVSLTTREKLCLVDVGGKHILVGVAPGQINNIHVFDEPVESIQDNTSDHQQTDFSSQLKQALGWQKQQKE